MGRKSDGFGCGVATPGTGMTVLNNLINHKIMTKTHKIVVIVLLFLCFFPFPGVESAEKGDLVFLFASKRMKNVTWDKKSIIAIDINCDGSKDYAIFGKSKQGVTVALVVGPFTEK